MYLLLLSLRHELYLMSVQNTSETREVSIVKRQTRVDSEDYVSIQVRSSEDSLENLLENAMSAVSEPTPKNIDTKVGVQ
jgi:hypothetical protein